MLLLFLGRVLTPPPFSGVYEWWIQMWNPYNRAIPITKSDTVNFFPGPAQSGGWATSEAIYVGGAGIVAAVFQDGTVVNFTAAAGEGRERDPGRTD